jgi:hypothetical protein
VKKETKYAGAVPSWNKLLKTDYGEEIKQAYKVDDIKVEAFYIIISSLGLMREKTESDLFKLLRWKGKESRNQ